MIPKKRIEQAAIDRCHYPDRLMFKIGFESGVSFAESELKQIAIDFAEWVELNCSALAGNLWEIVKDPNSEVFTAAELFDIFMEERSKQ